MPQVLFGPVFDLFRMYCDLFGSTPNPLIQGTSHKGTPEQASLPRSIVVDFW